jgi:hypothetical protein
MTQLKYMMIEVDSGMILTTLNKYGEDGWDAWHLEHLPNKPTMIIIHLKKAVLVG